MCHRCVSLYAIIYYGQCVNKYALIFNYAVTVCTYGKTTFKIKVKMTAICIVAG